ncbi:uncharacterized protein OCT59_001293 [Rhizophagus irregularis]|uniref:uncharacterized protein n=1 Tax=Rhizophagus irregularis TaxID=588596 RepID=UPI0019E45F50|nr:hypothetical protein OCT59_001293 [Rhizophagus irregularis]GET61340.1 hypothetical protein RIR_jg28024.t1 [Rhizophagus irregularis DAOM 181602=DAOM 197198]
MVEGSVSSYRASVLRLFSSWIVTNLSVSPPRAISLFLRRPSQCALAGMIVGVNPVEFEEVHPFQRC